MSFGFGVGDFLAVAKLANDIWQKLHDSLGQFADIRDEIKGYSSLLHSVSKTVSNQYLAPEQAEGLDASARACRSVLEDLQKLVDKYRRLTNEAHGLTANVRQKAKKLQWDQNDARDLRARITSTTTVLRGLCETIDRDQQARSELCQWLSQLDFTAQQREIYSRHQHGSGQWLLQSERFKRWLESEGGVLLCPGDPGAGKTVLASIAINHLWNEVRTDRIGVAYIYCDYLRYQEQRPIHLVGSLLKQLAEQQNPISESLRSYYYEHKKSNTDPTPKRAFEILKAECDNWDRIFIIVDALDECSEKDATRQIVVKGLLSLQGSERINILVISRPIPSILCNFETWERLEIRANSEDIHRYLLGQMDRFSKRILAEKDLQSKIIGEIIDAADGMFLLARLTFDTLVGHKTVKAVKGTLAKLSKGADSLDSAYEDAMKRIEDQDSDDRNIAKKTLLWISQGQRPLTVAELQQAVAIEPGDSDLDPDSMVDCDDIISACAGLVTRGHDSPDTEILRLVHYTTQEYFERNTTKYFPEAQKYLASSCLTYLLFDGFSGALCPPRQDDARCIDSNTRVVNKAGEIFCFGCTRCWTAEQHEAKPKGINKHYKLGRYRKDPCSFFRRKQYPFLKYAISYWGHHAENGDDEAIRILTKTFLDDTRRVSGVFYYSLSGLRSPYYYYRGPTYDNVTLQWEDFISDDSVRLELEDFNPGSAIQFLAYLGLRKLLSKRLEDGSEPDVKDKDGRTPLFWAVVMGHENVVRLLMTREDVNPNVRDRVGETPLMAAVLMESIVMVELMLAYKNFKLNTKDEYRGPSALSYALECSADVLQLLLACDHFEVNDKDLQGRTSLMIAIDCGNVEGTRLLLARDDIQVNAMDDEGRTALYITAKSNSIEPMRLLLAREDVQVNAMDNEGKTALHITAKSNSIEAMRLLLAREDIQVNAMDEEGSTALFLAVLWDSVEAMRLLLAREDIQVNAIDNEGETALHIADSAEAMRLLLAREDIQVNVRNNEGSTALHLAVKYSDFEVVQILLARDDLEVNATDENGESALFGAIENDSDTPNLELAELFLARGDVDLNIRNLYGYAPLHHAVRSGQPGVVQLFFTREDLEINIEDGEGGRLVSLAEHERDKADEGMKCDAYNTIIDLLRSYFLQRSSNTTSANILQQLPQRLAHTDDDDDD